MAVGSDVTTISEAAAEFGLAYTSFRRRYLDLDVIPSRPVPRCPNGKGFTSEQMERLREALGRREVAASA